MALVRLNFESEYLGNNHEIGVILPDKPRSVTPEAFYGSGKKYKVLYLLHGTFGDYSDWIRKSNIELYACEKDLIVVMPSAMNSDFVNWPAFGTGYDMGSYLTKELMPLIQNWFPASAKREDNFIAGLSMGGAGTIRYLLNHPDKFAGAAILSASAGNMDALKPYRDEKTYAFREKILSGEIEITTGRGKLGGRQLNSICKYETVGAYLDSVENSWDRFLESDVKALPRIFAACGKNDGGYAGFLNFKAFLTDLGAQAKFEEIDGYAHEWRFWDLTIQHAIEYFGIGEEKNAGNPF